MTSDRELRIRYADILGGDGDPDLVRLIADLHHVSQAGEIPAELLTRIERAHQEQQRSRAGTRSMGPRHRKLLRLPSRLALGVAVAVMLLSALVTPRALNPSRASAQVILRRAASTHLPSSLALHLVYRFWDGAGETGSDDTWQEWDRGGALARGSVWERTWTDGTMTEAMHSVESRTRVTVYRYLPASLVVFVSSFPARRISSGIVVGTDFSNGAGVGRFLADLSHHPQPDARLLPDRTLAGVPVRVVRVRTGPGYPAATLYIDSHSYILRGIDGGRSPGREAESMRLEREETVDVSAVPRGPFTLTTAGLMPVPEP